MQCRQAPWCQQVQDAHSAALHLRVCQAKGQVKHVILVVIRLRQLVIIVLVLHYHMTGGARQRALASPCHNHSKMPYAEASWLRGPQRRPGYRAASQMLPYAGSCQNLAKA